MILVPVVLRVRAWLAILAPILRRAWEFTFRRVVVFLFGANRAAQGLCPGCGESVTGPGVADLRRATTWCFECHFEFERRS